VAFSSAPSLRTVSRLFLLKQRKDESSSDYFLRLQDAARDPKTFEEMSLSEDVEEAPKPIRKGYQRIEDWDAETKQSSAWEEKVQFDGQRHGNRFAQNNILLKHLNNGW
jgi:hypothetical protein